MIVYGDPSFTASPAELRAAFERLAAARSLDAARDLLILCGEVEQAIIDAGENDDEARLATDSMGDAFLALRAGEAVSLPIPPVPDTPLRIKLPEGYAFYTLFPEQYLEATAAWLRENPKPCRVLVVGIRSIGTSLSALVAAHLRRNGTQAQRITVRPRGHPFRREAAIQVRERFDHAIVVDEGRDLSGSSIAAVISALRASGAGEVTIFPGHEQPPGNTASDEVRELWATTRKVVFPFLGGVQEKLKARTEDLLKSPVIAFADLSGGQWLSLVTRGAQPPAVPQLERSKFRFCTADGRALLWKFAGLGLGPGGWSLTEQAFHRQRRLARMGWCQPPLQISSGFIGTEWLEGKTATKDDCDPERARAIARYILDSSKLPRDQSDNFARLREMTLCNVEEAFGFEAKARVSDLASAATILPDELSSYGDGRIAPHEWLIAGEGFIKTDVWGHDLDHTIIGEQSILWDIAGALIEWEMSRPSESAFRREFQAAGLVWHESTLQFYEIAYLAFRLGLATMFSQSRQPYVEKLRAIFSD